MKIYLASSWRNNDYPLVLKMLCDCGHEVYDFRACHFNWNEIDPNYNAWTCVQFRDGLRHPLARNQYHRDLNAMTDAELFIAVAPFGRSVCCEMGWAAGKNIPTIIYYPDDNVSMEPELMFSLFYKIAIGRVGLFSELETLKKIMPQRKG